MTQIWSVNLIIGTGASQMIINNVAIKRLPVDILMADTSFVKRLISLAGEKEWSKVTRGLGATHPEVKVIYLKHLGAVAQEPAADEY